MRLPRVSRPGLAPPKRLAPVRASATVGEAAELRDMVKTLLEDRQELRQQVGDLTQNMKVLMDDFERKEGGIDRTLIKREGYAGGSQARLAFRPKGNMIQPAHVSEMGHEALAHLAMQGNHCAHRERLLREIMDVDNCTWEEAHVVLAKMDQYEEQFYWLESMPYRLGITGGFLAAFGSYVMVFSKPVAAWYAVNIVNEDLPVNLADLTINQVGTWTWAWMEPMIGTASFILLCAQFGRSQLAKMNMKPYTEYLLHFRADRVAKRFPAYDRSMVRAWAKHVPPVKWNFFPDYSRNRSLRGPSSGL